MLCFARRTWREGERNNWGGEGGVGCGGELSECAGDGTHESVERRAGVALSEVGGGEAADEAVDAEAVHGLVAQAKARGRVATHDDAPAAHDLAVLVNDEDAGPEE